MSAGIRKGNKRETTTSIRKRVKKEWLAIVVGDGKGGKKNGSTFVN